ncbi:Alpha-tocopherol transfer protein-like [Araneus ventricosus]|uniref:Alpha-tocopherol transfer protein-like n=1 Tax=Araneus ventricosus TaxID=182803 RepID=A0A4Y2JC17_ARAVE|nr:Alpha-tocopherol transfer protein-like [Araneus ventricosus]
MNEFFRKGVKVDIKANFHAVKACKRSLSGEEKNLKCRTDDEFLLQFLRARKFNVKNAFARLQTLYQVMSKTFADVYADIDDERAKKAFGSGFGSHLPFRDREGAAVVLMRMSSWKVEDIDVCSIMNCSAALHLSAADYPATQVCGLHLLADVKGTTLKHMRCLSPRFLYLVSKALRDTLPVRFKGIHLINASAIFRYIWSIVNIFLSEKIRKRNSSTFDDIDFDRTIKTCELWL